MDRLRLIPLDDTVAFPGMAVTLPVDVGTDTKVLLVPRQEEAYAKVGVVAEVSERLRLAGRGFAASLMPLHRAIPGAAAEDEHGVLRVGFEARPDVAPAPALTRELEREYRAVVDEILEMRGDDGRIRAFVRSITEPGALADTAGYSPDLTFAQKRELLETLDVVDRLKLAIAFQRERMAELQVRKRIKDDVDDGAQKQQREYFLRKQMDAIRKELGENDGSLADEYRQKIAAANMPEAVRSQAERELDRFERMGESNAESSMIRTYLDWLLAVPWDKRSEERLDPVHAREVLDADHEGLDDVKRRITEYLAVRKLRSERGLTENRRSGVILTLIGPPGTGKTSIGESIARATGRQFVRMSLGGVRDEAEIRGHRRTYVGALPGRLVRALRDAGTMNPVIMLDEVDKIGRTGEATRRRRCSRSSTPRRTTPSAIITWTSSSTSRRCSSSPPRTWPTRSRPRSSTGWRSSGSTATRPRRRSESRARTSGPGSWSATACGPVKSRPTTPCCVWS
jgi:ATP-dependent Lon protease